MSNSSLQSLKDGYNDHLLLDSLVERKSGKAGMRGMDEVFCRLHSGQAITTPGRYCAAPIQLDMGYLKVKYIFVKD